MGLRRLVDSLVCSEGWRVVTSFLPVETLDHRDSILEVGNDQSILADPNMSHDLFGVDDEQRPLCQTAVSLPDVVLHSVGMSGLTLPIREQREIDSQCLGKRHLREGRGHRNRCRFGTEAPEQWCQ